MKEKKRRKKIEVDNINSNTSFIHTPFTQLINLIQEYGFNQIIDQLIYYINLDEDELEDDPNETEVEKILKDLLLKTGKDILNLYFLKLVYLYQKKNFNIYKLYDAYMIEEEEILKKELELKRLLEEQKEKERQEELKRQEEKRKLKKLKKKEKRKKRKEEKRKRKEEKRRKKEEKRKKKKEEKDKKKKEKKDDMNWRLVPTYEDYLKI